MTITATTATVDADRLATRILANANLAARAMESAEDILEALHIPGAATTPEQLAELADLANEHATTARVHARVAQVFAEALPDYGATAAQIARADRLADHADTDAYLARQAASDIAEAIA